MFNNSQKLLSWFEKIFSVLSLLHLSNALFPLLISQGASEGDGIDPMSFDYSLNAKILLLIYFIAFILLFLRWKKVLPVLVRGRLIWLLIIFAGFSYFWSALPEQTFRYVIYGIGTTAFGLYLATRYTLKEQLDILAGTFAVAVVLSLIFIVALPHYGIMGGVHAGAFRGIYTHKNQFGIIMALASVIFFLKAIARTSRSWLFWLLMVLAIALVVMARSTTSLGNMGVMLLSCCFYRIFRWRYEILISAILGILVTGIAGILLFINFVESDLLFVVLGKDATFSGRTEIWSYVWDMIQLRPWRGYGLAAFWNGLDGPSAYVQRALRVPVAYAHNGFLDLWLGIGFIGLAIFLLGLFNYIGKSLALLRQSNSPEGFWPLIFFTYVFLSNISEGTMTTMDNIFWAVYATLAFSLVVARQDKYLISY
ncbi:MAG TPA: O-antigen ligase family protein [Xenococcaceae cyanobacterium]